MILIIFGTANDLGAQKYFKTLHKVRGITMTVIANCLCSAGKIVCPRTADALRFCFFVARSTVMPCCGERPIAVVRGKKQKHAQTTVRIRIQPVLTGKVDSTPEESRDFRPGASHVIVFGVPVC